MKSLKEALHLKTGRAGEIAAKKALQCSATGESLSKASFNPHSVSQTVQAG